MRLQVHALMLALVRVGKLTGAYQVVSKLLHACLPNADWHTSSTSCLAHWASLHMCEEKLPQACTFSTRPSTHPVLCSKHTRSG